MTPLDSPAEARRRAPRNRTLGLDADEARRLRARLVPATALRRPPGTAAAPPLDLVVHGDCREVLPALPPAFCDLLILDPPYNTGRSSPRREALRSGVAGERFARLSACAYADGLGAVLDAALPALRPTASVYVCGDWRSGAAIQDACANRLIVRNRITWERDKGRGARRNWKNGCEDIWFCTVSDRYLFDLDAVKLRRRVRAPYRGADGAPKDWREHAGGRFRDTHPSNLWTDVTVPFWSMPENTDHPTQKPEKLFAKLMLASTAPGDVVLDPFLGSGTSAVVASKLGRRFLGIEADEGFALLALLRLERAAHDPAIQGYADGVFWERNSRPPTGGLGAP